MTDNPGWQPRHDDPLLILAMDHRASFGKTLFEVKNDDPDPDQLAAMQAAKRLIFAGLRAALPSLSFGRAGVLVDERYGQDVIDDAQRGEPPVVLAIPVEASGHDWFTLEWGDQWLSHVETIKPDYAKVLVRDNPDFDPAQREQQFERLAQVSSGLRGIGVPLLYELLVPATDSQLDRAGHDAGAYDRDVRPGLVVQVIADNQAHGVEPTLWKVEGLETAEAAQQVAGQARAGAGPPTSSCWAGTRPRSAWITGSRWPARSAPSWASPSAAASGKTRYVTTRPQPATRRPLPPRATRSPSAI